ncbi:MAG: hypothetical protein JSU94_15920 [Phycisphaerales bacterium]|nr:MAG: hypothetical protein JSU94_15920 [Phycisphaerales bacterium]
MAKSARSRKGNDSSLLRVDASDRTQEQTLFPVAINLTGWPMIIGWLAMLIFTFHACTHMVAAGDTWVAMACGRHFTNHGVDTVEPFSANSHRPGPTPEEIETWPGWARNIADKVGIETVKKWHPTGWINQNWLTHVIFYTLVPKSSYADGLNLTSNALVYWKFAIYIITVICVFYTARLLGVHPALAAAFACFAMFIGRSFLDIRPAGFSNMLVAVFLLVLALATHRNVLYLWLLVPLAVFWCNIHGGYIYVFIVLVPFIGLHLLRRLSRKWIAILYNFTAWPFYYWAVSKIDVSAVPQKERPGLYLQALLLLLGLLVLDVVLVFFKKSLVSIKSKGVFHAISAYIVAFFAVLLFNPFHLTNLTHTFVISVSKHAERWRDIHEWHPAFEWTNPVGTAVPFLVMYIIAWVVLVAWVAVRVVSASSEKASAAQRSKTGREYESPKFDLPLTTIAALTIYMAIRSRRFIPIAGIVACPVIAMFIDQMARALAAHLGYLKDRKFVVPRMSQNLQWSFALAGVAAVLFFGTWWGLKFKRIYLDPWPSDPNLTSVFMRMTASDAKPFHALRFIKDNKLKGKMFNYWTEGGFIAWGQEPDPNTGHTPLQLFMDGRAQAAYDRRNFDIWSTIMAGGETVRAAMARRAALTTADYREIGQFIDQSLKARDVWIVLMPANQFREPFVRGLEHNASWPIVFFNGKQRIFVDITTPQGKQLFDGISSGKTLFPDEFSKNLTIAHNLLVYRRSDQPASLILDYAVRAFRENPSPVPMLIMLNAFKFAELKSPINDFCRQYVDDFMKNRPVWLKKNGYRLRIDAVRMAAQHLESIARAEGKRQLADSYLAQRQICSADLLRAASSMRW